MTSSPQEQVPELAVDDVAISKFGMKTLCSFVCCFFWVFFLRFDLVVCVRACVCAGVCARACIFMLICLRSNTN